jgi:Lrp/AsnC family leucine-responsive transcriptional regulator
MAANQRSNGAFGSESTLLDDTNRLLLTELQADARLSIAELGRRVGLSAPAVAERMQRLQEAGVITGYHAHVDPRALGYPLTAIVRIRPQPGQLPNIADAARETPEIVECHRITGEDCFIFKLHLRSIEELEDVLDRFVVLGQTTTSIVQSSPVAGRPLGAAPRLRATS